MNKAEINFRLNSNLERLNDFEVASISNDDSNLIEAYSDIINNINDDIEALENISNNQDTELCPECFHKFDKYTTLCDNCGCEIN